MARGRERREEKQCILWYHDHSWLLSGDSVSIRVHEVREARTHDRQFSPFEFLTMLLYSMLLGSPAVT